MNFIKPLQKAINVKLENNAKIKIRESFDGSTTDNLHFYVGELDRLVEIQKNIMITGAKRISVDVAILIIFILLMIQ